MELETLTIPLKMNTSGFNPAVAGIVAGITAAVGAMVGAIAITAKWANELDSLGDVMGGTKEQIAAMAYVARVSGVGVETLAKANVILEKGLTKANGRLDTIGIALQKYGIKVKDVNGQVKDQATLTDEISKKYQSFATQQERVNFLTEIYGKNGAALVDFFDTLAQQGGIDAVTQKVSNLGLAIDSGRYEQFNRNLEELKMIGVALAVAFTEKVMPLLEGFLGWITKMASNPKFRAIADQIGQFVSSIPQFIQEAARHPAFQALISTFQQIGEKIGVFIGAVTEKVRAWVQDNMPLIQQFGQVMMNVWLNNILPAVEQAWNGIEPILMGLVDLILGLAKIVMQVATGDWKGAWQTLKETAVNVFNALVNGVAGIIQAVLTLFHTSVPEIANNIVEWKNALEDKLRDIGKVFYDRVTGWINQAKLSLSAGKQSLLDKITEIKDAINGILSKILTSFKLNFSIGNNTSSSTPAPSGGGSTGGGHPQRRASGGSVTAGSLYNVNELGKGEYFIPNMNGRINSEPSNKPVVARIDRRDMEMFADMVVQKALRTA